MNLLPPLTEEEFGRLRESVERDGVHGNPVLLDRSGNVIDGHHRLKLAAELGIEWPTKTLDVDDETADRLRITLNVARRQLTTLARHELIAWLAARHEEQARREAKERKAEGGRRGNPGKDVASPATSSGRLDSREVIADRINADLAAHGETLRVNGRGVDYSRRVAALPEEKKRQVRAGEVTLNAVVHPSSSPQRKKRPVNTGRLRDRPTRPQELDELARIRATDAEHQYRSMLNAPPQKLNLPLIRRAEKIMELLTELIALEPATAVSQLPIERCRDFTVKHAEWWSEFARLCEERRATETPDLPPRPYRPVSAVLNPVVLGTADIPTEERGLTPGERAILDWLRVQEHPVTVVEIAVGLRKQSKDSVELRVRKLRASGLVEVVGKVGNQSAYRAQPKKPA